MLFNSLEFLIFFPLVTLLYFWIPQQYRWLHLLIASCIFYAAFIPIYILILLFTIVIDYIAGIVIEDSEGQKRRNYLILSLVANIGVLAVFKYYNFFIDNFNELFTSLHVSLNLPMLKMLLPIGLSFHTFQAMSYTIEVYRGNQKAERHFGIYALYVMFYPQLVAGPIERPQNVLHQFHEKHDFDNQQFMDGFRLMLWGMFKKVVIADRLSIYVNIIYGHPEQYHYLNLFLAALFFSIQIYCDFSGYSDIAIGAAQTMGFKLMTNFNRPYFSTNIQEFWAKWHISLSTWFRDYLYISLGGNRVAVRRMYFNVAVVFLVSGFWHGANWTFLIWGAMHAVFIVAYMLYKRYSTIKLPDNLFSNGIALITTFMIVTIAWVYFRAESVSSANAFLSHLFHFETPAAFTFDVKNTDLGFIFNKFSLVIVAFSVLIMGIIEKIYSPDLMKVSKNTYWDVFFSIGILTLIICFGVFKQQSFIYFQF